MPIETTKSFKCSDGSVHPTLEHAQRAEVVILFPSDQYNTAVPADIFAAREKLMEIFGIKARKPRTPKVAKTETPAQVLKSKKA